MTTKEVINFRNLFLQNVCLSFKVSQVRLKIVKMRVQFFIASVLGRTINDREYKYASTRAIQPAEIFSIDHYVFEEPTDLQLFLPIGTEKLFGI